MTTRGDGSTRAAKRDAGCPERRVTACGAAHATAVVSAERGRGGVSSRRSRVRAARAVLRAGRYTLCERRDGTERDQAERTESQIDACAPVVSAKPLAAHRWPGGKQDPDDGEHGRDHERQVEQRGVTSVMQTTQQQRRDGEGHR